MTDFFGWLNEKRLFVEIFGSFSYQLPENRRQQMFDFYVLSMLQGRSSFDLSRNREVAKSGFDIYQMGGPKSPSPEDMNDEDKVDYMLDEVSKEMLPKLKQQLLDELSLAIAAEFRHITDNNDANKLYTKLKSSLGDTYAEYFKKYVKRLTLINKDATFFKRDKEHQIKSPPVNNSDYKNSYQIAMSIMQPDDFVRLAGFLFKEADWEQNYGGESWASIAEGWQKLNKAKTLSQMKIWIDHVYDLQHNTGSVFTKLADYYSTANGYAWIKNSLDKKAGVETPLEMIDEVSPQFKKVVLRAAKLKFGKTLEDINREIESPKPRESQKDNQEPALTIPNIFHKYFKMRGVSGEIAFVRTVREFQQKVGISTENAIAVCLEQLPGYEDTDVVNMVKKDIEDELFFTNAPNLSIEAVVSGVENYIKDGMINPIYDDLYTLRPEKTDGIVSMVKIAREFLKWQLIPVKKLCDGIHYYWHKENLCNCTKHLPQELINSHKNVLYNRFNVLLDDFKQNNFLNLDQNSLIVMAFAKSIQGSVQNTIIKSNLLKEILDKHQSSFHAMNMPQNWEQSVLRLFFAYEKIEESLRHELHPQNVDKASLQLWVNKNKNLFDLIDASFKSESIRIIEEMILHHNSTGYIANQIKQLIGWSDYIIVNLVTTLHIRLHVMNKCNCNWHKNQ